jgi:hypothetical protein
VTNNTLMAGPVKLNLGPDAALRALPIIAPDSAIRATYSMAALGRNATKTIMAGMI